MNRKPSFLEKVTEFISGKGFYLVVLVCVAAIGISGYFLMRSLMEVGDPVAAVGQTQMPAASSGVRPSVPVSPRPTPSSAPAESPQASSEPQVSAPPTASPSVQPSAEVSQKPAALVFTWPVNGVILAPHSVETLLYDETMLDWRVHEGIDIAAAIGTRVLAAAAGTVLDIYEDDLMGVTLILDHGEGLESVYANLGSFPDVEIGERVYTGDVIGAVGNTAAAEIGRDPHLHFAMYQDQFPANPEDYLPAR